MFGAFRNFAVSKAMHFLGTVDEPFYSWLNALGNAVLLWKHPERVTHPGDLHPDKTFYIIRDLPPDTGLASWYDRVTGYVMRAERKGWTPVIDPPPPIQADYGVWYDFFRGFNDIPVAEALKGRNVVFATTQAMIYKRFNWKNIRRRHEVVGRIRFSEEARRFVDSRMPDLFAGMPRPVVGVRFRGTDYRVKDGWRPVGHATVPDVDVFCDRVEEDLARWNIERGEGEHVYVVTEEQEALDAIRRRFPKCRYVEKERFANFTFGKSLAFRRLPTMTPRMNNMMYLLEIRALVECDYLIGGYNGGVLVALNRKGDGYRGVDIINTGVS